MPMNPMAMMMLAQMMQQGQGQGGPAMVPPPPGGQIPQNIPGLFPPGGPPGPGGQLMPDPALAGQVTGMMPMNGGPVEPVQGGIAGMMSNPALQHGLLGAGAGLMAASGPTEMPTSMGQAASSGLMGALRGAAGYNAMQRQQERDEQMDQLLRDVLGGEMGIAQQQGVGTLREPGPDRRRLAGALMAGGAF